MTAVSSIRRFAFRSLLGGLGVVMVGAETPRSPVDELDQAALQETFRVLRKNYIERERLTLEELNRAALEGLLHRLDFGAEIVLLPTAAPTSGENASPPAAPAETALPLVSEPLNDALAYLRPGRWSPEEIPAATEALRGFAAAKIPTLILDGRSPAPPGEFATAAQWLNLFLPPDQALFSVQKPDEARPVQFRSTGAPAWTGRLVLLLDEETNNIGETMAAVLIAALQPPVFGSPTRGRTMEYQTVPLTKTHGLRFASAEMRLADGTSLFREGLSPAMTAPFEPEVKAKVFAASAAEGVKKFITDRERPRHNEASLVAGAAPDLPYQVAKSAGQATEYDTPPVQDRALQQVFDTLESRRFLEP